MRRIAAALTLTALVLAGCGGDDDDATDTTTTTEAAETTAAPDATTAPADETTAPASEEPTDDTAATDEPATGGSCPYVTTAALDEALGTTFEELAGNEAACTFSGEDGLSVQVSRIDIQIDPETYAEESTSSCEEGTLQEVDAGDSAFACIAIGPTATVFEGSVAINLGVLSADDEDAVLDGFVQVLPEVTIP